MRHSPAEVLPPDFFVGHESGRLRSGGDAVLHPLGCLLASLLGQFAATYDYALYDARKNAEKD
jgi:hypothetical protein